MTRDEAIKIAATTLRDYVIHEGHGEWASAVVARADALLAAMGEPAQYINPVIKEMQQNMLGMANMNAKPAPPVCCKSGECAATEARVVREIAEWCRKSSLPVTASEIERGDWRAKESK